MKFQKGHTVNSGRIPWNKGKLMPDSVREANSKSHSGTKHQNWGKHLSKETKKSIGDAQRGNKNHRFGKEPWNKGIKLPQFSGNKCHLWKGGLTPINDRLRKSVEYKIWRKAVFERDNYTCVWCGNNESGNLNADHIKAFSLYPALRFEISNGRTLCVPCHQKTDSYLNHRMKLSPTP